MEFRILGPVEVTDHGRKVDLGGPRPKALLAMLLLRRGTVVPLEQLVDRLYGGQPPRAAAKSVQVHISRLRKALAGGCEIRSSGGGYQLVLAADSTLDAEVFEELADRGRQALADGNASLASSLLADALGLWRGPALADFRYEDFAQRDIARLEERRQSVVEDRIEADLELGHADLVPELQALVAEYPLRERAHGQLMLALYRAGRQAEALEAYQAARSALVDELGIEPGRELRELHQAILRQEDLLELVRAEPALAESEPGEAFVGRERELGELVDALVEASAGRGRIVLLQGEPGIGKSRLAEQAIRRANAGGARVLVGRCWEAGGAPVYWPWVQALRTYVRSSDAPSLRTELGHGAREIAHLLPELRDLFPDVPEPLAPDSDGARFRLFDAAAEFLRRAAETRPLVVLLDDLHAADASSLLLLQYVARTVGESRLVIIGAYRDVDPTPGPTLTNVLTDIAREHAARRIVLRGLQADDVAAYVEATASEIASAELVAALHEETEGNPLFVGEMVRLLAAEGLSSPLRLAIPHTVRDVIARRLSYLSADCNRVLLLASVLGREFAPAALGPLGDLAEETVLDALDEAAAARVVSDVPGVAGRARFAHVLIRDTLYEGITGPRRVRLHRDVVNVLADLYGDDDGPHLAELAHHALAADDAESALLYAERAGARALAVLGHEEAARLYETALTALDRARPDDDRRRCKLLLSLGAAQARAGNTSAADEALLVAADIARRLGLSRELGFAAAEYGGRKVWGRGSDVPGLVDLLEEALAGLADDEVELRARVLARLAGALRDDPRRERRDAISAKAIEVARRADNPVALVDALDGRAMAILAPDTLHECVEVASELLEVAERIGDRERIVDGHMQRAAAQIVIGDMAAVRADLAAASVLAVELRQRAYLWDVCGARAMIAIGAGYLAEADQLVEQALALGERVLAGAIPVHRVQRYTLAEFRGGLEDMEPAIRELVAANPARPVFRCVLAHLDARLGRREAAAQALRELSAGGFADVPFDQEWLLATSLLAETVALAGDKEAAAVLYDLLLPWSALNAADMGEGMRGSMSRYLALLATALERSGAAERHFEDALAANEKLGLRPWLALTQHDYARHFDSRDLRDRALAAFDELGMVAPA